MSLTQTPTLAASSMTAVSRLGSIRPARRALRMLAVFAVTLLPASLLALGQAISTVPTSSLFAGTGATTYNGDFGSATSIALNSPSYIVFDSLGNEFFTDTNNNCVRRIDGVSGNVTTVAGLKVSGQGDTCNTATNATPTPAQGLYKPTGLAIDGANNLYIADTDHNCVRRLPANSVGSSTLTTIAGTCTATSTLSATPQPAGLAIDSSNNLYIAINDTEVLPAVSNYQVLLHTNGQAATALCTIAGNPSVLVPTACANANGTVVLNQPNGLALDFNSNLYVADTGNNCIRQVLGTTTAPTTAGKCVNDGTGSAASALNSPYGIVFSLVQSLFITQPNNVLRYIPNTGALSVLGGLPSGAAGPYDSSQNGKSSLNGPLSTPRGIAIDQYTNFYVADSGNNIVRELSFNQIFPTTPVNSISASQPITFQVNQAVNLSAVAGTDYKITSNTCSGSLTPAAAGSPPNTCQFFVQFTPTRPGLRNSPLVVTDTISATTITQGLQGTATGSLGIFAPGIVNTLASSLASPVAAAIDSTGNAYILEKGVGTGNADVREIPASGAPSSLVVRTPNGLGSPSAIATDAAGDWFITDASKGTVARYGADGAINSSFITGLVSPSGIATDGFGNLYIAQQGTAHNVIEVFASGPTRVVAGSGTNANANGVAATASKLVTPTGIAIDVNGVLYITDPGSHRVYAIDRTGLIHYLAGNGTTTTTNAGIALGTALISPTSVAVDAAADVYIADSAANKVYAIYATSASGTNIATILGTGTAGNTGDGGPSILGTVNGPLSVAVDSVGNDYIVDAGNNSIRKITFPLPTINFGKVAINTSSPAMQQYYSNIGTDPLNLNSALTTSDSHFTIDSASTTCGTSVLPGAICAIGYIFTPTQAVAYTASSVLASNSFNSPQTVNLGGSGQALATPGIAAAAETEVYGAPFVGSITVTGTPAPTGTLTFTGPSSQVFCTFTGTLSPTTTCTGAATGLAVGTYQVSVSYSGDTNYLPFSQIVTLTVTKAPLTVTLNNQTRPYNTANPTLTYTGPTGVEYTDTFTVTPSTTATVTSPAGTYPITATVTGTNLADYTLTVTPGTLTVTQATAAQATPVVTCANASRQYGAANPTFTSTTTGTLNGDTFTVNCTTTATPVSPLGTYTIVPSVSGQAAGNYAAITLNNGTLTVTQAATTTTLTASATTIGSGASITYTATVTDAFSASVGLPAGTVNFYNGNALLGPGTLSNTGVATYTTNSLPAGALTINAIYQATANFASSMGSLTTNVTGPVGSFTLAAGPPTAYVRGAATTSFAVAVTSIGGFAGPVALSCSGLPADAKCTFGTQTVVLTAGQQFPTTMTVVNTAADAKLIAPQVFVPNAPGSGVLGPITLASVIPFELGGLGVLFAGLTGRRKLDPRRFRALLAVLFTLGVLGLAGCGCPNSTFMTYPVTITATSVNGGAPAQIAVVYLSVGLQ